MIIVVPPLAPFLDATDFTLMMSENKMWRMSRPMILVCLLALLPLAGSFQPHGLMPTIQRHHGCRPPPRQPSRAAAAAARTSLFPDPRSQLRMALTDGQTASVAEEGKLQRNDGLQQAAHVRLASLDEYKDLSAIIADVFAPNMGEAKWWWSRFQAYTGMIERVLVSSFEEGLVAAEEEAAKEGRRRSTSSASAKSLGPVALHAVYVAVCDDEQEKEADAQNIVGLVELTVAPCPIPVEAEGEGKADMFGRKERRGAAYICNLAVVDGQRGRGIGSKLMDSCEQAAIDKGCSEIFLETDCDNGVALGLYQQRGYVCEMLDPPIRIKRRCYLRKRLSEEAPESDVDMLAFEGGSPVFVVGEGGRGVAEESFLEKHFGVLAPSVAALGGVIGVIFF